MRLVSPKIQAILLLILLLSSNTLALNEESYSFKESEMNLVIQGAISGVHGFLSGSSAKAIINQVIQIKIGAMNVYIGPRMFNIISNFISILSSGDISAEKLKEFGKDEGLSLVGIAAGAYIGYKLTSLLAIQNPVWKIGFIIGVSMIGEKTVEFLKKDNPIEELQISFEQLKKIEDFENTLIPMVIEFIKSNYLQLSLFYINNCM